MHNEKIFQACSSFCLRSITVVRERNLRLDEKTASLQKNTSVGVAAPNATSISNDSISAKDTIEQPGTPVSDLEHSTSPCSFTASEDPSHGQELDYEGTEEIATASYSAANGRGHIDTSSGTDASQASSTYAWKDFEAG